MTQFSPEWKISVNGYELTNTTLANLTITAGRRNIYEQATAGYCNLQVIVLDGSTLAIDINDSVIVEIKDSSGTFIPIFGGFVNEYSNGITSIGSVGITQTINILALGALARLPRALTSGVLAKAFDGDQIYTVLSQVLFDTWAEVPAATTWATYDATTTWTNAGNSGLGEIDRPGDYELHARASSTTDIYSLAAQLANSGLGYLYEDAQGRISYADSTHRSEYLAANGYVDLDAGQALGNGMIIETRGGDVRNSVTITYKSGQQVSAQDLTSQTLYGLLAQNFTTTLENGADATSQANFYLELRAYPQGNLQQINFNLSNDEIDDSDRDNLLGVFMGMPINLSGMPANMGSNFQGFVEGWTFTASYNSLAVTLLLTPVAYSLQAFRWNSVPVAETWNTIDPTLDWLNATVVA